MADANGGHPLTTCAAQTPHSHTRESAMQTPLPQPPVSQDTRRTDSPPYVVQPPLLTPLNAARLMAIGALLMAVAIGLLAFLLYKPQPAPIVMHPPPTPAPTATPLPTATPSPLTVFVSGGVARPGLYVLGWDARVGDALAAAGGLQEGVDEARVNQAERLFDGAQVHAPEAETANAGSSESGPPSGLSGTLALSAAAGGSTSGLVNLNTASADGLMSLPGIGPSKAAAIIANRPYDSVDDLDRVPGFGAKTIDQLREMVTTR
ncbi:MAG: ComEA family DNA-binding protein [Chloroflexi bacterium]|nr:ComEA family DNA-binding protein [Chloroflexota bacterium]